MSITIELDAKNNQTGFSGLIMYFDLMSHLNLYATLTERLSDYHPNQGWDAASIVIIVVVLNLAGYESVSDINYMLADEGLVMLYRQFLKKEMSSSEWRKWLRRFNKKSNNTLPSATVIRDFLSSFHDPEMVAKKGEAIIHQNNTRLNALNFVLFYLVEVAYIKSGRPKRITIDQDATIVETYKAKALYTYMMNKGYQPVNNYCVELGCVIGTEFRDGNVPAKMNLMEMFQTSLLNLPKGIKSIDYRGDSGSCNLNFMKAMDNGTLSDKYDIKFAISALITPRVKSIYDTIPSSEWQRYDSKQEFAETTYTHEALGTGCSLRLIIVRTKQSDKKKIPKPKKINSKQMEIELNIDLIVEPKENEVRKEGVIYELRGVLSNIPIERFSTVKLLEWSRKRAGKAEHLHAIQKTDLSGGRMPSGQFGANAAWWIITCIVCNIHAILNIVALPKFLKNKRFKTIRAKLINCVGRISTAARGFTVKIGNASIYSLMRIIRRKLQVSFSN
jgi:hypothetical protein